MLANRVVHGFWSLGAVEIPQTVSFAKRVVFLDQIAERVIDKLALPLPVNVMPRTPEIAARMVDAIFDYIESPPGRLRWQRWHESAIARGGNVPMAQAAAELGAPAWFLAVLAAALDKADAADCIAVAVRPKAPKARVLFCRGDAAMTTVTIPLKDRKPTPRELFAGMASALQRLGGMCDQTSDAIMTEMNSDTGPDFERAAAAINVRIG